MLKKGKAGKLNYYVYGRDDISPCAPAIVHIHGAGSRGADPDAAIAANPILRYAASADRFPFRVIAPQCGEDTWFDAYESLNDFLDTVVRREAGEGVPLYLSGISMGGYCSWQILMSRPGFFRKAIICCGGGMYWNAGRIVTPVRAFHGREDDVVFPEESEKMAAAVNRVRPLVELKIYDGVGHDVWNRVYTDDDNYEWLLK